MSAERGGLAAFAFEARAGIGGAERFANVAAVVHLLSVQDRAIKTRLCCACGSLCDVENRYYKSQKSVKTGKNR